MRPLWAAQGQALLAAFHHILIISLARSHDRRDVLRSFLIRDLGLQERDFQFVEAVDCKTYGRWSPSLVPEPWLHERDCRKGDFRHQVATSGGCLSTRWQHCRSSAEGCGGVCYTLSVAVALRQFLGSGRQRVLCVHPPLPLPPPFLPPLLVPLTLLSSGVGRARLHRLVEDDLCASDLMASDASLRVLARLAEMGDGTDRPWGLAKLAHCTRKSRVAGEGGNRTLVQMPDDSCVRPGDASEARLRAERQRNELRDGPGRSFCAHAIGLDRETARGLLRLASPFTNIFDDILFSLDGGFGAPARSELLRRANLTTEEGLPHLRAVHLSDSLFAQSSSDPRDHTVESLTGARADG